MKQTEMRAKLKALGFVEESKTNHIWLTRPGREGGHVLHRGSAPMAPNQWKLMVSNRQRDGLVDPDEADRLLGRPAKPMERERELVTAGAPPPAKDAQGAGAAAPPEAPGAPASNGAGPSQGDGKAQERPWPPAQLAPVVPGTQQAPGPDGYRLAPMKVTAHFGAQVGPNERAEVVWVGPVTASTWLAEQAVTNRPLNHDRIVGYTEQMREGLWVGRNGETVKFDDRDRLVDGQHRLAAIVASGRQQLCFVIRGVPHQAGQDTTDLGQARSMGQLLKIRRFSYALEFSSALGHYRRITLRPGQWPYGRDLTVPKLWNSVNANTMRMYTMEPLPAGWDKNATDEPLPECTAMRAFGRMTKHLPGIQTGLLAALWLAFAEAADEPTADKFWHGVARPDDPGADVRPGEGDPRWVLRQELMRLAMKADRLGKTLSRQSGTRYTAAICILAWNRYLADADTFRLYFNASKPGLPLIYRLDAEGEVSETPAAPAYSPGTEDD